MLSVVIIIALLTSVYHSFKHLPTDVSFNGDFHSVEDIEFLYDLTYMTESEERVHEQMIFDEIDEVIGRATEFIVIDMFLFNDDYDRSHSFPQVSMHLVEALMKKKKEFPQIEIVFITDRINTFYGTYMTEQLQLLKSHGIEVIETDLRKLRDSNPLYSGFWRAYVQWFGKQGFTWLPNSFGSDSPSVHLRSYLELLNFKANHRKVVITEKEAIITSANPHDASAYHSNIGFRVSGELIADLLRTEKAVASFSGGRIHAQYRPKETALNSRTQVKVITEGQIKVELLKAIEATEAEDEIMIGMFYFSERKLVKALQRAAERGVSVKLILDPNKDAFGMKKNGIPNRQVANELVKSSPVEVRWYDTHGEQYHSKLTFIKTKKHDIIIGGSANLTKRNLNDLNLETNIMIVTVKDEQIGNAVLHYFETIWNNTNGHYTADYLKYADDSFPRKIMYHFQEWSGLGTF